MLKTGLGSDAISLHGYVELKDIVDWHRNSGYSHVLKRDTPEMMFDVETRTKFYDIEQYLTSEMTLLDFGCSTGLFGFYLSDKVKSITGVDYNKKQISVANKFKVEKGKSNCEFICKHFTEFFDSKNNISFDFILLLALVDHIKKDTKISNLELVNILKTKLNINGYILIESAPMRTELNTLPPANYNETWNEFYTVLKNDKDLEEIYTKSSRENRMLHLLKKIC